MAEPLSELLSRTADVVVLARELTAAGSFALDLEFVSEDRYIPELALVQVAWEDGSDVRLAAVDPLAADPGPVFELVASGEVEVIAHAARQDLALLWERFQLRATGLWDTQIAAAFAGLGEQLGYARLVGQLLSVSLDKGQQYADWLARPLPPARLRYALDDVRYLLPVWRLLRERLERRERIDWAREESARRATAAASPRPPEERYRNVGGFQALRGPALGALRSLAAWREREARQSNKPPSWILADGALIELSKRLAASERDLRRARGVGPGTVRRYADAILAAIAEGAAAPLDPPAARPLSARGQAWAQMVTTLIQARAAAEEIPPRLLGARGDAEDLLRVHEGLAREEEASLLVGWRREVVGNLALDWLAGKLALVADPEAPGGVRLEPR